MKPVKISASKVKGLGLDVSSIEYQIEKLCKEPCGLGVYAFHLRLTGENHDKTLHYMIHKTENDPRNEFLKEFFCRMHTDYYGHVIIGERSYSAHNPESFYDWKGVLVKSR